MNREQIALLRSLVQLVPPTQNLNVFKYVESVLPLLTFKEACDLRRDGLYAHFYVMEGAWYISTEDMSLHRLCD
jgi:hypothetical protein